MDKLINMLIQWFDPITIDIGCRIFVHSKAGGKAKKRVITWCKFNILFDFNGLWYIEIVSGLAELVISKGISSPGATLNSWDTVGYKFFTQQKGARDFSQTPVFLIGDPRGDSNPGFSILLQMVISS